MLVALEQGKASPQLHDGREFPVFLESLTDRVGSGGIYGEHVRTIHGSALDDLFARYKTHDRECGGLSLVRTTSEWDHQAAMSAHTNQPARILRGLSRFRLRVQLSTAGIRPYAWEIYDEEDTKVVRRSQGTFRTSADAWEAGLVVLQTPD